MNEYILTAAREHQDLNGKIRTFTGKYVNPLDMRKEDIDIRDIAHHLANECRYAGACPEHYSVAQHSVIVSRYGYDPEEKLAGLLHDAAEAYLKDMPSPIKHDPRMKWYRELDESLTLLIFDHFGLEASLLPPTKLADSDTFKREVRSFWGGQYVPIDIVPWSPRTAEANFLVAFDEYRYAMKAVA